MSVGKTRPELPTNVSTPKPVHPRAQGVGIESSHERRDLLAARAVAAEERLERLRMRDVHAAFARHQKFAADRRHGVIDVDLHALLDERLGGHQAGGAAADHGDAGGIE